MPNYDLAGGTGASSYSLTDVDKSAMGAVAMTAIASWNSFQMDKINYQMQMDQLNFQKEARAENRRFSAFVTMQNKDKLNEAMMSEKLALDIDQMKSKASVQNEAQVYNFNAAPSIVRDIERQMLRQDLYQEREQRNRMQQVDAAGVDASRSPSVLYEPAKPDAMNQVAEFTTSALQIGEAAYGRFTKGN